MCEIDQPCRNFLKRAWPGVPIHDDIKTLDATQWLGTIDLLCGGPPCQPASRAGKQRGKEDDRWLWGEALRIIEECQPTWILLENPPGIADVGLDGILASLEGQDYEIGVLDIPACAVDSPQIRHRFWILAYSSRERPGESDSYLGRTVERDVADSSCQRRQQIATSPLEDESQHAGWTTPGNNLPASDVQSNVAHSRSELRGTRGTEPAGQQRPVETSESLQHMAHCIRSGRGTDMQEREAERRVTDRGISEGNVANAGGISSNEWWSLRHGKAQRTGARTIDEGLSPWSNYVWMPCADGKVRRAPDDSFGLVDGLHRSILGALGNSIVPKVAFEIFKAMKQASEPRVKT